MTKHYLFSVETEIILYMFKDGKKKIGNNWIQIDNKASAEFVVQEIVEILESYTARLFGADYQHKMHSRII